MSLAGVKKAKEELARKRGGGSGGKNWLKIAEGEEVTVRPLEQDDDFKTVYVHSVEKVINGKKIFTDAVCLDQEGKGRVPCPGCEERAKIADPKKDRRYARRFKFYLNVIWRNGPIYETEKVEKDDGTSYQKIKRNDAGDLIEKGRGDVLALWSGGIRAAEELDHANSKYKGLMSRDFTIEREGTGLDTKYKVSPAVDEDGDPVPKTPLSDEDKEIAAKKYDLDELAKPTSYEDFWDGGYGGGSGDSESPSREEAAQKVSPFKRKRQQQEEE